ncbi:choline transporter-like protein 4 [Python bivittatus]|uniref:Choline transporter-like protein 4 n=1 Tax=Python bivittatus TaxID=176946 RepID=A0A9F5MXL4_PYTBI|nr:choline transporter-like protein 4 [Python bivittatus]
MQPPFLFVILLDRMCSHSSFFFSPGEKCQYDPSFRGPIQKRSCTDIICCVIFGVFIAGYIVVGLLAWLYGDPRQVIYPRNSTGSYCGVGSNRDKPYLLYFNLIKCVMDLNPLAVAMKGLQCPTTQICVSSCTDKFWVVPPSALIPPSPLHTMKPSVVWNQTLCQPSIDLKTTNLTVSEILNQQLCPEFTIPTMPLINRCLPSFNTSQVGNFNVSGMTQNETLSYITNGTQQLISSLGVKDISMKIFEDLTRTWYWILM